MRLVGVKSSVSLLLILASLGSEDEGCWTRRVLAREMFRDFPMLLELVGASINHVQRARADITIHRMRGMVRGNKGQRSPLAPWGIYLFEYALIIFL